MGTAKQAEEKKARFAKRKAGINRQTLAMVEEANAARKRMQHQLQNESGATYLDNLRAAFKREHGSCPECHGVDPYCVRLGLRKCLDGETRYLPNIGRAAERLRFELAFKREDPGIMTEDVKAKLREVGAKRKAEKLCPGDMFTWRGAGYRVEHANGEVRCTVWAPGKDSAEVIIPGRDIVAAFARKEITRVPVHKKGT